MKMKSMVMIMVLSVTSFGVFAQTNQGSISIGGALGFSSYKLENETESTETTFGVMPQLGYFIADGMEIGIIGEFSVNNDEGVFGDTKTTTFAAGPFFKYYMFTSNEKFAFTLGASALFGAIKESPEAGDDVKGSEIAIAVSPGFSYFFTNRLGLDFQLAGISFNSYKPNKDADFKESQFVFGLASLNPSLGFRYFISR
jgi:outer membrane protein